MKANPRKTTKGKRATEAARWSKVELERLAEEATVDCYGESECISGFYTMIENDLAVPFDTEVLGTPVTVESVDLNEREEIVAICRKGSQRQRISLCDLPLPSPPPAGAEWIAAYRHWAKAWNGEKEYES